MLLQVSGTFEELLDEAARTPFHGWDFSWLRARSTVEELPWDYRAEVLRHARDKVMLDMGTGGGEVLVRMRPPSQFTVATEAWPPNVPVAARRLAEVGIPVVQDEGAPENLEGTPARGRLSFRDAAFGLVSNRHEAFNAMEVARVLRPGGVFVTQQVDLHSYDDFREALDLPAEDTPPSWLPAARAQLEAAGLDVSMSESGEEVTSFNDVGAVAWYLTAVPWVVPEFEASRHRPHLRRIHDTGRPFIARQRRFLLVGAKAE